MMIGWECGIGPIARGTQPQFLDEPLLISLLVLFLALVARYTERRDGMDEILGVRRRLSEGSRV
jgi:hypothetical protein